MRANVGSLEEPDSLRDAIAEADAVIYSAYGYNDKADAEREIASGRSHLTWMLEAMANTGKKLILTSGTGVYPDTGDKIYTEEMPFPHADSPITIARRNLEQEVLNASATAVHSIVLRPPTVYGRAGSFLVPRLLLDHALSTRESIYIEGTVNNRWSAVHVDDLADLYILALKHAQPGTLFNTASESGVTTRQIAESISRAARLGGKITPVSLQRSRDLFQHWGEWWGINNQCSGEKAMSDLGWKPHRPRLLDDIERGSYKSKVEVPS